MIRRCWPPATRRSCRQDTLHGGQRRHHVTGPTAPVVAACDGQGLPLHVEWAGVFFRREADQERARRHRRGDTIRAQLEAIGVEAVRFADQLVDLAWEEATDDQDDLMRRIAMGVLLANGRQDLWQLSYLEFNRGNQYVLGDEQRFLTRGS